MSTNTAIYASLLRNMQELKSQIDSRQIHFLNAEDHQAGICYWLLANRAPISVRNLFDSVCTQWPKFSGSHLYPVPSPHKASSAWECYDAYRGSTDMWLNSPYAELRYDLICFAIDYCQSVIGYKEDTSET